MQPMTECLKQTESEKSPEKDEKTFSPKKQGFLRRQKQRLSDWLNQPSYYYPEEQFVVAFCQECVYSNLLFHIGMLGLSKYYPTAEGQFRNRIVCENCYKKKLAIEILTTAERRMKSIIRNKKVDSEHSPNKQEAHSGSE